MLSTITDNENENSNEPNSIKKYEASPKLRWCWRLPLALVFFFTTREGNYTFPTNIISTRLRRGAFNQTKLELPVSLFLILLLHLYHRHPAIETGSKRKIEISEI
jgi:hypothetical protein